MKPSEINTVIDDSMRAGLTFEGTIKAIKVVLVDQERRIAALEGRLSDDGDEVR